MEWTEVQIKTTAELEDIIINILYDVGATGLAIEDPRDILELTQTRVDWDFIDSSLIDLEPDVILIKAYFSEHEDLDFIIQAIRDKIRDHPMISNEENILTISLVSDDDWSESWKKYYKPVNIGERIVIKPSWEEHYPKEGEIIIELDPGMAFGTGTHETTIMCIEALEKYIKAGDIVYDIGCGSGILSVVSSKLGADKVIGVDLDELCVKISNENILLNKVEDLIDIRRGNLLDVITGKADVIVSNIIAEIIVGMTGDIKEFLKDKGIFIASGIINSKVDLVETALIDSGFNIVDIINRNEWVCIVAINN